MTFGSLGTTMSGISQKCILRCVIALAAGAAQLHPLAAFAEPCWMIGCTGRVGYVFMPDAIYPPGGREHFEMDGQTCVFSGVKPFPGDVPEVNSVAQITGAGALLMTDDAISTHLGSFPGASWIRDATTGQCRIVQHTPIDVPGDLLGAGAKVRILGYRTFTSQGSETGSAGAVTRHEQLLFALVLVVSNKE